MRCENDACGYTAIAYNSCRNRHCPKCQGAAAREWMEARAAELLPVPYFHVVFTLPSAIGDIAYQNKAVIYDLLFKASRRDDADDRGRPQASRRQDRHHRGAAHLGIGDDPSSARAHDRAGRRHLARWITVDRQAARLLSARARAVEAVPQADAREARGRTRRRPVDVLRRARRARRHARRSPPIWRRSRGRAGSSTPSARSPGPRRCSPICRATRIASRSRTGV